MLWLTRLTRTLPALDTVQYSTVQYSTVSSLSLIVHLLHHRLQPLEILLLGVGSEPEVVRGSPAGEIKCRVMRSLPMCYYLMVSPLT